MVTASQLDQLRRVITENLRIEVRSNEEGAYVDVGNALSKATARQNHVIFGRRGCGKSLLLFESAKQSDKQVRTIYLNCEDFKNHSFPNVLIEILDSIFRELEKNLSAWFGRKKKCRELIASIRTELQSLKTQADERTSQVREKSASGSEATVGLGANLLDKQMLLSIRDKSSTSAAVEREYQNVDSKIQRLNLSLVGFKRQIGEAFELSTNVNAVFLHLDDFYHLQRTVQPHIIDYIHRLCKGLPLFFKVATLRHASVLFVERMGQPTGAQDRHDYQPLDVDFTLEDVRKTERQLKEIFATFVQRAGMIKDDFDALFKGEGFRRLMLAGGGVPRDCLSIFIEMLDSSGETGKIGKDEIRNMSLSNFERRIEELKRDSQDSEQDSLMKGIYVLRQFCLEKKSNIFMVSEQTLRERDTFKELVYRLLDYRIVHSVGSAYTHKSMKGSFQAFMIDIGSYAFMRKLHGKLNEVDLFAREAKESIRNAPILDVRDLERLLQASPSNTERMLLETGD